MPYHVPSPRTRAGTAVLRRAILSASAALLAACGEERSPAGPDECPRPSVVAAPLRSAAPLPPSPFDAAFEAAGAEFGVPAPLLEAIGWVETRWHMVEGSEEHEGMPAAYGIMALRGERLERGARLAGVSVEAARREPAANIRAAAALLAAEAAELGLDRSRLDAWEGAVARFSGIGLPAGRASYVHDGVYAVLREGTGRPRRDLAPSAAVVVRSNTAACPEPITPTLPAAPDYPTAFWRASPNYNARPADSTGVVHMIIVHTCEGSYAGCWSWLTNSVSQVSAHYVVDEDGGEISQLVAEPSRAWHIGAMYDCALNHGHDCGLNGVQSNHVTIGIEHAGYASQPSFPASQTDASARLACDITRDRGIPRDRQHIVAHGQLQPYNRTDPGPNWPWTEYVALVQRHCGEAVVDDGDEDNDTDFATARASASWSAARQASGYYGRGYRWAPTTETEDDPVVFSFYLESPGQKTLDARWTAGENRTGRARFTVVSAAGSTLGTVEADQRTGGGEWHELGRWDFPAGWNRVLLSRRGASGAVVVADAVRAR